MESANRIKLIASHITQQTPLVLYGSKQNVITVTLNRPKALNSLNLQMVRSLTSHLQFIDQHQIAWFQGAGDKAFCAGGDAKQLYESKEFVKDILTFSREVFTLGYRISQMKALQISCWDGIVMGGGVGISVFAPIVIATEKTIFAMPQVKLGYFPDVGVIYILSRLRNNIGLYLGMTGAKLKGEQVYIAGLAHFYIPSDKLQLAYQQIRSMAKTQEKGNVKQEAYEILKRYHHPSGKQQLENQKEIKTLFGLASGVEVYQEAIGRNDKFHLKIVKMLQQSCPVSVQLTYRLIRNAKALPLRKCFQMDFQIMEHMSKNQDFKEGARAVVIQKGGIPKWNCKTLQDVKQQTINNFFVSVQNTKPLQI